MSHDFGIIITTYAGDFYLTKALLASIKKFIPDVPICIIQDGNFSIDEVVEFYNISYVIKKQDVKDDFLRNNCFGSRCTNMIAFWEGPFDKFLYLDSDLVLWGNVLRHLELTGVDFIHNQPHENYTEKIYKSQYFDYTRIFNFMPYFDWEKCNFFNAGVFIGKKAIFSLDDFKQLYHLWKRDRTLLPAEPQGIINYLVFFLQEKSGLIVTEAHLQTNVPVLSTAHLEKKFVFSNGEPVVEQDTVIHWAGVKPLMMNREKVFTAPEVYFRKLHLKNIGSLWRFAPTIYFYYEEVKGVLDVYHKGSIWVYFQRKIYGLFK